VQLSYQHCLFCYRGNGLGTNDLELALGIGWECEWSRTKWEWEYECFVRIGGIETQKSLPFTCEIWRKYHLALSNGHLRAEWSASRVTWARWNFQSATHCSYITAHDVRRAVCAVCRGWLTQQRSAVALTTPVLFMLGLACQRSRCVDLFVRAVGCRTAMRVVCSGVHSAADIHISQTVRLKPVETQFLVTFHAEVS